MYQEVENLCYFFIIIYFIRKQCHLEECESIKLMVAYTCWFYCILGIRPFSFLFTPLLFGPACLKARILITENLEFQILSESF